MILVDANLLIYARVRGLPRHEKARRWLDALLNETTRVGLPWPSLLTFPAGFASATFEISASAIPWAPTLAITATYVGAMRKVTAKP